ncbi:MAG: TRAP transporter substrate-binding protein DctP [Candidatus Bathyarchaeia archaeon]
MRVFLRFVLCVLLGGLLLFTPYVGKASEVTLTYATFFYPNEQGGILAQKFIEFAEKASKGQLKFKTFFSGALGAPPEYLRLIETGAIDLTTIIPPLVQKDFPLYLLVPYALPGGEEKSLKVYRRMVLEDPELSAIIAKETGEKSMRFLTFVSMGPNAIISKQPISSLKDLRGKKMGGAEEEWKEFGVTGVALTPQEGYEALARGLVDMFSMGFTPSIDLKYYEVAKCYLMDNLFGVGLPIAINSKKWAALPKEIQEVLLKAGKDLSDFSVQQAKTQTQKGLELLKAKGVEVRYLSPEETMTMVKVIELKHRRNKMLGRAKERGKEAEAQKVVTIVDKILAEEYGIKVD